VFRQPWFKMSCFQPWCFDHRYLWEEADAETIWGRYICPQGWWAQRDRGHRQWGSRHPADCLRREPCCQLSLRLSVSAYGFLLGPVFLFLLGAWVYIPAEIKSCVTTRFQQHLCLTCIDDDALSSWLPSFFLATVYLSASDYNSWTRWLFLSVPWTFYVYILEVRSEMRRVR